MSNHARGPNAAAGNIQTTGFASGVTWVSRWAGSCCLSRRVTCGGCSMIVSSCFEGDNSNRKPHGCSVQAHSVAPDANSQNPASGVAIMPPKKIRLGIEKREWG
ncbi:hypothetical protein [Paraburkholderia terrae]|uniref:hypothetical protein n=1 Tax=Paraburkholderia terrae TaxID=311230 RepID=UPI0033659327